MLLRFLKLKVIVNGRIIYPLEKEKPVVVPLVANRALLVVTDGFHYTYPMEVNWQNKLVQHIKIACAIDDEQLFLGFLLLLLFYVAGLTSNILFLKVLSFAPIVVFIYLYYLKRKDFIKVWMV